MHDPNQMPKKPKAEYDEYYRWDDAAFKDINVYEDLKLKNRPIGFIWPEHNLIQTK